ncbi:MAG: sigma-54-dependent Fis family transcriptional regulator [Halothiobacillus sp. 20-53-49]|nr:MAG: sigma-54-dependent Fis family transcriptional regulator [Halothiobacillus sp. 20-53-49]HUN00096.1 sigma-54 dependent transcriptional regulator [Halothiobacillus sp.]
MTDCLIVDDEHDIRTLIALSLRREAVTCHLAADLTQARAILAEHGAELSFCLTDMHLPDGDGLDLLDEIRAQFPLLPVAVITAHGQVDAAVRALKAGAFDFVSKPIEQQVLKRLLRDALKAHALSQPSAAITHEAPAAAAHEIERDTAERLPSTSDTPPLGAPRRGDQTSDSPLIGASLLMQNLRETLQKVARTQAPVFICGESGTGKDLVARQIHAHSGRAGGPFIPVNCGAIPAELIESELFGHKKGAFTGANTANLGLFRAAEGGSLFLDEVAELPLGLQVKLLRAIQERKVRPVGESAEVPIDIRIISASHQDLNAAVREGRFRHDLFYRLNVIELRVPPLRARLDDLPALSAHILHKLCEREQRAPVMLTADALAWLAAQPFEGNVRELENRLERALALTEGAVLNRPALADESLPTAAPLPAEGMIAAWQVSPATSPIEAEEQRQVLHALQHTRWNRTEAARQLGLTLRQLRYRLAKWGVDS